MTNNKFYGFIRSTKDLIEEFLVAGFAKIIIIAFIAIIYGLYLFIGNSISTGEGEYQGMIVETRHHGIFFKTNAVHLKTGENSSIFEDFCVIDNELFNKIKNMPKNIPVSIVYTKKLAALPWDCSVSDSSDIVVDIKSLPTHTGNNHAN